MVSTHLRKNISQIGSSPQVGGKKEKTYLKPPTTNQSLYKLPPSSHPASTYREPSGFVIPHDAMAPLDPLVPVGGNVDGADGWQADE